MKIKPFFTNISLLLISCVVFFVIVEAAFKTLHFFSDPEVSPTDIEGLPYENTPNGWFLRYAPVNGWIFYKNNSLGMRDPERAFAKPYGVKRIVCLGDSIIFGGEVSFKDIFTRQLERMLKKELGNNVEVLNCGTTSYSLREYKIYLEKKGLKFNPDLVLIGLCLNDFKTMFHQDEVKDAASEIAPKTKIKKRRLDIMKIRRFILHSYFIEYVKDAMKNLDREKRQKIDAEYNESKDPNSWISTREYFARIEELGHHNGAGLLVVIFPIADQLSGSVSETQPQKYIKKMLQGLDIFYADALPIYSEYTAKGKKVFSRFDGVHPLPLGHLLAAGLAKDIILEKDLLRCKN